MADQKVSTLFLSFSGHDRDAAREIRQRLVEQLPDTVEVWFDETGIPAGDNWVRKLQQEIAACSAYVILWGEAGDRRWVAAELSFALQRHFEQGLPIFPLLMPGVSADSLPPFLGIFQARNVEGLDYAALADQLVRAADNVQIIQRQGDPDHCPFPGLEAFQENQQDDFFGRQSETVEALRKLGMGDDGSYRRWLLVEGPSGVGKSSLVRAGMLPAIRSGWLNGGRNLDWILPQPIRPGDKPLTSLAHGIQRGLKAAGSGKDLDDVLAKLEPENGRDDALALLLRQELPENTRLLLVIDQLEEIFTLTKDKTHRARFDTLLTEALADQDGPLHLLTTIRSDFTIHFDKIPRLEEELNDQGRYYLAPMSRAGIADAVRTPARRNGLDWSDEDLPGDLIDEAAQAGRGALPLLGNLLRLMWNKRQGTTLTRQVYKDLDGLGGALARSAEGLLNSLGKDGRPLADRLLLALVNANVADQPTRRTIPLETALQTLGGESGRWVLDRLSGQRDASLPQDMATPRLITVYPDENGQDQVELAHEALLARDAEDWPYWQTLSDLVEAQRLNMERRALLEWLAWDWQRKGCPRFSGLLGGRQLREFRPVAGAKEPATAFLKASRRWRRIKLGGLAAVSALVVVSGLHVRDVMESEGWKQKPEFSTFVEVAWAQIEGPILPNLVEIPAGSFTTTGGVEIIIKESFRMGAYEVTFAEYDRYVMLTDSRFPEDEGWGRENRPVIDVSWQDARAYTVWISENSALDCRLPSDAEWEYAIRAGTATDYWWGDEIGENRANCDGCGSQWDSKETAPVDAFDASDWQLHQPLVASGVKQDWLLHGVHGNVLEWVEDCHDREGMPADGSSQSCRDEDSTRVLRGGSWFSSPDLARSSSRYWYYPVIRNNNAGFRVVCSAPIR